MEIYGKALARYRGRGRLFLRGETPLPCQVNVVQRSDGVIFVECQLIGDHALGIKADQSEARCVILHSGGLRVAACHLFGPNKYGIRSYRRGAGWIRAVTLLYYANQVDVSREPRRTPPSHARFAIVNFEYVGTEWQKISFERAGKKWHKTGTSKFLGALRICQPSGEILFESVNDHEETVKRLKAVEGIDVTCFATVSLGPAVSLSRAIQDMEDLCALLSLARGTKINWAYFDTLSEAGDKVHTRHVSRVTKPFASFPLIHPDYADDLLSFLQCFQRFRGAEELYSLKRVVDHYTDAKAYRPFLEARGMLAAILIDYLLGRHRNLTDRQSIRKDFDRASVQRLLRRGLRELLSSALSNVTNDEEEQLLENLKSLNRPAFRRVLGEFADSLGIRVSQAEIRRITKIRNNLVHNASFLHDTDNHTQYFHLVNFLDRILLGILGYTGYYVDCTRNWQRTESFPSEPNNEHRC